MNSSSFKQWLTNEGKALDVGTKAFKNEQQALKAAIVVWKGDPSKLRTHVQDEIDGTPPPDGSEKITQERREMAAALLKAVREKSEIAPTLYRGAISESLAIVSELFFFPF